MQSSSPSLFTLVDLTFGAARPSISKPNIIISILGKSETNAIRAKVEVAPPYKALRLLAYLQFLKGKQVPIIMVSCLPQVLVPDVAEGCEKSLLGWEHVHNIPRAFVIFL